MKKVIVIGCPGSGKSTFSKALAEKTGLPLCHLDLLYWNPDRTTVTRAVFTERLQEVLQDESWIVDGNYAATMEMRLKACDTVFFLDYPPEVCLEGVQKRKGQLRSDMPWVESADETDEEFMAFIKEYPAKSRPEVIRLLETYPDKRVVVFHSRPEADRFLSRLTFP